MSQAQANAEVVAQHREEILFDLFSRYILVIGHRAMMLVSIGGFIFDRKS